MKSVFDWIIKHAWNLFGVIGVALTFYFSIMYVPGYVKEITTGKVTVIHESLMDNIQELLFYEKTVSIEDINSFIQGKELKQGVSYPYNPDELLVQIQDRFMGNKFIPLEKREALLKQIKSIRAKYVPPETPPEKPFDRTIVISWLLSGLGVIIATIGAVSITKKFKNDKETELDIIASDAAINQFHGSMVAAALEYEKMVGEILDELGVLKLSKNSSHDQCYDFLASDKNKEYIIEVKHYKKLLGLGTAREFLYKVNTSGKGGILVVSSGVTHRTKQLIEEHNRMSDNQKVHLIVGDSKGSVKNQLAELFEVKTSNK